MHAFLVWGQTIEGFTFAPPAVGVQATTRGACTGVCAGHGAMGACIYSSIAAQHSGITDINFTAVRLLDCFADWQLLSGLSNKQHLV
jgi:hypothetical protein